MECDISTSPSLMKKGGVFKDRKKIWRFSFFSFFFFLFLSLDDYSVASLNIPSFGELEESHGELLVRRTVGGGAKFGSSSVDDIYLITDKKSTKFSCKISEKNQGECVSFGDPMFYEVKKENRKKYITVKNFQVLPKAHIWWCKTSYFGVFDTKLVLQMEVNGLRVLSYKQQKEKYLQQKRDHGYVYASLLVLSIIWLGVLLISGFSTISTKGK